MLRNQTFNAATPPFWGTARTDGPMTCPATHFIGTTFYARGAGKIRQYRDGLPARLKV
jgi:hypothetical protein